MSQVQTKTTRAQPDDYYPPDEDYGSEGESGLEEGDGETRSEEGVNLNHDQWSRLLKELEGENRPNKSNLLKIVRDAMSADAKGNEAKEAQDYALLAQQLGEDPASLLGLGDEQDPNAGGALKTKIDDLKKKIDASKMPDDVKTKKKAELDALVDLKPNDDTDVEGTLDEIGKETELYTKYSPATIRLAQKLTGGSEEGVEGASSSENLPDESTLKNIEDKAKSHGIDLSNPPNPPTPEMVEFLEDLSPELKEKFDAVKQAATDRQTFYQTELTRAKAVNESNVASGDDDDNKDISAHQHLYDLKYYQDEKSKTLATAMQEATKDFADLYGAAIGQKVDTVKPESGAGWQTAYNQAKVADQISVGGNTIDLFNNTTGEVQTSGSPDTETIETVTVEFDNGDGNKWKPVGNGYGEEFKTHSYQEDSPPYDGFGSGIWAGIKGGWKYGGPIGSVIGGAGGLAYDVGKGAYNAGKDLIDDIF